MNWLYSGASVVGQSHLTTSTPCQDKFQIQTSRDGTWLALAVCDGAGSAEFAEQGATITSQYFCQELIKLSQALDTRTPGEWINDFVIQCVIEVRNQLRSAAKSDDIRKYHCTLVAVLLGKSGGFSIHIGDGAVIGGSLKQGNQSKEVELNSEFFISKPENGEYANETFFITEGNWVKHLRITPLPPLDWLVVSTDGGASLLLDNDFQVKPNFLSPFLETLINNKFTDHSYIQSVLDDPKANKLTSDDKTIVAAVRYSAITLPAVYKFSVDEKISTGNTAMTAPTTPASTQPFKAVNSTPNKSSPPSSGAFIKKNPSPRNKIFGKLITVLSILILSCLIAFTWLYRDFLETELLNIGSSRTTSPKKMEAAPAAPPLNTAPITEKVSNETAGH